MMAEAVEAVGRQYLRNAIEALEESKPGWLPMFYFTGSCEGDLAEAKRLRALLDEETKESPTHD